MSCIIRDALGFLLRSGCHCIASRRQAFPISSEDASCDTPEISWLLNGWFWSRMGTWLQTPNITLGAFCRVPIWPKLALVRDPLHLAVRPLLISP